MNATRRGLNRFLLFLVAVVLLGLGALALAVGPLPGGTDTWTSVMGGFQGWLESLAVSPPAGAPSRPSWSWRSS